MDVQILLISAIGPIGIPAFLRKAKTLVWRLIAKKFQDLYLLKIGEGYLLKIGEQYLLRIVERYPLIFHILIGWLICMRKHVSFGTRVRVDKKQGSAAADITTPELSQIHLLLGNRHLAGSNVCAMTLTTAMTLTACKLIKFPHP